MRYLNGTMSYSLIPNESTLILKLSETEGQALSLQAAIDWANGKASCVYLFGNEENKFEYEKLIKEIKEKKLKICLRMKEIPETEISADYVVVGGKVYVKDYSPFGDAEVWIDVQSGGDIRKFT